MLSFNYYAGSVNGANYQQKNQDTTTRREVAINIINRVCNTYSIDNSVLISILDKYPSEFIGYVFNSNADVRIDKKIQNLIEDALEEDGYIYEEDDIIDILTSLNYGN